MHAAISSTVIPPSTGITEVDMDATTIATDTTLAADPRGTEDCVACNIRWWDIRHLDTCITETADTEDWLNIVEDRADMTEVEDPDTITVPAEGDMVPAAEDIVLVEEVTVVPAQVWEVTTITEAPAAMDPAVTWTVDIAAAIPVAV